MSFLLLFLCYNRVSLDWMSDFISLTPLTHQDQKSGASRILNSNVVQFCEWPTQLACWWYGCRLCCSISTFTDFLGQQEVPRIQLDAIHSQNLQFPVKYIFLLSQSVFFLPEPVFVSSQLDFLPQELFFLLLQSGILPLQEAFIGSGSAP